MAGTVVQGARVWTGPSHLARSRHHPKLRPSHSGLLAPRSHPIASSSPFLSRDIAGGDGGIFCLDP